MPSEAPDSTIYIVDDDEAVRDSLQMLLQSAGYPTVALASGRALLDQFESIVTGCVVADVRMPDMTGLELQDHLNERKANLSVIIMTGHADVPMAVRAMKAGATDFIEKPFAEQTILTAVQRALAIASRRGQDAPTLSEHATRLAGLTTREREVLQLLVHGRANKVIAYELDISPRTVEVHRARVMEKTGADSLAHLIRIALAAGIPVGLD